MLQSFTQLIKDSYSGLSRDIWLLAFITLINRTGSMVILFMTIYLTTELNFTLIEAGMAMSCFGAGSVAGAWIGGFLTDRIGYYKTMFGSLIIGGFSFFILMYMTSFNSFCVMVFFVSTIADAFRPAAMASISAYAKPENHNRSLSLIRLAINLGFATGAALTGLLSAHYGYQWLFIIDGSTCILAAFFLLLVLKDKKEKVIHTEEEDNTVSDNSMSAYQDYTYLSFLFFKMLAAIVFMQLFSTVPLFMKEVLLFSEDQYGLIMMCNGLIIVALEMPLVYILEKKYDRMSLVIAGYLLIVTGFFSLCFAQYAVYAIITYFILAISIGEVIGFPFSNAFALSRSKVGRRGEFMGLYSMAFSIAFIVSPSLGTYIAESYGFPTLWSVMTGIGLISVAGFVITKRKIQREESLVETAVAESTIV